MVAVNIIGKRILLLTGLVVLFLQATSSGAAPSWHWIDVQRVGNLMMEGSGFWLIDVRSEAAYEAGHIEGSVNIAAAVLAHKKFAAQKMLVLVDDSLGQKTAREAAQALAENGQERVAVLEGGIAAWKMEGLPAVENRDTVGSVTAAELKWAIANSIPLKIYDLRDKKARSEPALVFEREAGKGTQKSETIPGKTLAERVEKLKNDLAGNKKKKGLAEKLKKPQPVVLVFAASDDAEEYTRKIMQTAKADIRYLIGGYEAMIADQLRKQQTVGSCPTCPGSAE